MSNGNTYSYESLQTVRDLTAQAKQRARALQVQAEEADRIERAWQELSEYLERGWHVHAINWMETQSPLLRKMRADRHPAVPSLEAAFRVSKEQADQLRRRFPAFLEEACRSAGLSPDRDSYHPDYRFESGFFRVHVDDGQGTAILTDYEGELGRFPADPEAIVEKVRAERSRVFERPFDGAAVLRKLRSQYLAITKRENKQDGDDLPIRSITRRLGKNEKGFRTDEFLIDLSRLVERGPAQIDGYQIDLKQIKDTTQGMLLHGQAGRGYIGYITFRRV